MMRRFLISLSLTFIPAGLFAESVRLRDSARTYRGERSVPLARRVGGAGVEAVGRHLQDPDRPAAHAVAAPAEDDGVDPSG